MSNVSDPITNPKVQQQPVEQETGEPRRFTVSRDQVLNRLWEIGNMDPERTRNSMSAQVKAISIIVAIEGLIPLRRAVPAQNKPAPSSEAHNFYKSAWNRPEDAENVGPQPPETPAQVQSQDEDAAPATQSEPVPTPDPGESSYFGTPLNTPQMTSAVPRVPMADHFAPDTRTSFSIPKKPFGRRHF
jgi:hypothetical protein